eukprot:1936727-Amphidinium_carterae.1
MNFIAKLLEKELTAMIPGYCQDAADRKYQEMAVICINRRRKIFVETAHKQHCNNRVDRLARMALFQLAGMPSLPMYSCVSS